MTINLSLILWTTRIQKQFPLSFFIFIDSLVVSTLQDAGGYAISRQNNLELHLGCHTCWLSYFTLVYLWCGRTVARAGGRSVYGHVITKFSRMARFLTHGAPLLSYKRRFKTTTKMDRHITGHVMWRSDGFPISDWVSLEVFVFFNSGCITRCALAWPHVLLNQVVVVFFCLVVPNHFHPSQALCCP